ncbi:hypothetical protein BO85DRAFT_197861 [Aspergillus piperis CBS 112811]|uniref:Uncharacterized protein n=1 Tax=Aspergillus piperis CBS 112811 TaxID=1448313 RepID=A0A8G1QQQ8_9EURO|nr:hypothetical protein BO85DRAFT_197861 [Aspergillus piperis CBS 112811]RAH52541.1 hypothetical protein BO85DRAFT_197861 [Aspergillus piperis CBS 112811]
MNLHTHHDQDFFFAPRPDFPEVERTLQGLPAPSVFSPTDPDLPSYNYQAIRTYLHTKNYKKQGTIYIWKLIIEPSLIQQKHKAHTKIERRKKRKKEPLISPNQTTPNQAYQPILLSLTQWKKGMDSDGRYLAPSQEKLSNRMRERERERGKVGKHIQGPTKFSNLPKKPTPTHTPFYFPS